MEYDFSWTWFLGGVALILAATAFIRFHQWIADNFGSGVVDYDRYKLYGLIAIGVGFLAMINLVPLILGWAFSMIFGRGAGSGDVAPLEAAIIVIQALI